MVHELRKPAPGRVRSSRACTWQACSRENPSPPHAAVRDCGPGQDSPGLSEPARAGMLHAALQVGILHLGAEQFWTDYAAVVCDALLAACPAQALSIHSERLPAHLPCAPMGPPVPH